MSLSSLCRVSGTSGRGSGSDFLSWDAPLARVDTECTARALRRNPIRWGAALHPNGRSFGLGAPPLRFRFRQAGQPVRRATRSGRRAGRGLEPLGSLSGHAPGGKAGSRLPGACPCGGYRLQTSMTLPRFLLRLSTMVAPVHDSGANCRSDRRLMDNSAVLCLHIVTFLNCAQAPNACLLQKIGKPVGECQL